MEQQKKRTKMVFVMRKDLGMTKGKYIVKAVDGAMGLHQDIDKGDNLRHKEILDDWFKYSYVKACVSVKSEEELDGIYAHAKEKGHAVTLITDDGTTMFKGVITKTCVVLIGYIEEVDEITGHLPLL